MAQQRGEERTRKVSLITQGCQFLTWDSMGESCCCALSVITRLPHFPLQLPLHNWFMCLIQVILEAFYSLGQVGHVEVPT
jgi:hypothetical protein